MCVDRQGVESQPGGERCIGKRRRGGHRRRRPHLIGGQEVRAQDQGGAGGTVIAHKSQ